MIKPCDVWMCDSKADEESYHYFKNQPLVYFKEMDGIGVWIFGSEYKWGHLVEPRYRMKEVK